MKLLCFDVDDTLIGPDKVFRQSTIDHLNKRLALGDVVSIVSGRPYIGIMQFLNRLQEGKKYPIGANGAAVYDIQGKVLMVNGLSFGDYLAFHQAHLNLVALGAQIYCYTLDKIGYFEQGDFTEWEVKWNGIEGLDLAQHPLTPETPILKFMIAWDNPDWSKLVLSEEEKAKYHLIQSDPRFVEFTNPKADKAYGVEFLRRYLGISKQDVYTFGDQGNDVLMIQNYQGVAMGNAIPEAKKVAAFVTLDSIHDGVSYALDHFVK
jgi:Cof subfamily protein (haloacid dehalogenase superfamily)